MLGFCYILKFQINLQEKETQKFLNSRNSCYIANIQIQILILNIT